MNSHVFAILFALVLTSPLIYWAVDRGDPVQIRAMYLVPDEIEPGGTIFRNVTAFRLRSCHTDPTITITDSSRTQWRIDEPASYNPGVTGVEDAYKIPVKIPTGIAYGPAEMRVTVARRCNPLHVLWPQVTRYEPMKFKVVSKPTT